MEHREGHPRTETCWQCKGQRTPPFPAVVQANAARADSQLLGLFGYPLAPPTPLLSVLEGEERNTVKKSNFQVETLIG